WSGTLSDDKIGAIGGNPITLAASSNQTFTASEPVSADVCNTATARGGLGDAAATSASKAASATVTGHVCTVSLTKTPSATNVCNGTSLTYPHSFPTRRSSDLWSGTLSDDKIGAIGGNPITLAASSNQTFTAS